MEANKAQAAVHADGDAKKDPSGLPRRKGKAQPKSQTQSPVKTKAKAKAPAKGAKRAAKMSQAALGKLAAAELFKVRALLKEVSAGIADRLDGEAAALALFLEGQTLPGERAVLPNARALKAILATFAQLKVKPKKGRVKDLARIELLLVALADKMPPGA